MRPPTGKLVRAMSQLDVADMQHPTRSRARL